MSQHQQFPSSKRSPEPITMPKEQFLNHLADVHHPSELQSFFLLYLLSLNLSF